MITRVEDDKLLVVTQPDHAELAGHLAIRWGNDQFSKPNPETPMVLAASEHDNGWREWDNKPTIDSETGLPYTFADLDYVEHTKLYWRGVLRAVDEDPYEGLMVAMHYVGLYRQRYGTDLAMTRRPKGEAEENAVAKATEEGENLQSKLRDQLSTNSDYSHASGDVAVWANYKLLQALDRLALLVCWKGLVSYTLTHVPVNYDGEEVDVTVTPQDGDAIELSPYPFEGDNITFSARRRIVPLSKYESDEEFRSVYYRAPRQEFSFIVQPPK